MRSIWYLLSFVSVCVCARVCVCMVCVCTCVSVCVCVCVCSLCASANVLVFCVSVLERDFVCASVCVHACRVTDVPCRGTDVQHVGVQSTSAMYQRSTSINKGDIRRGNNDDS